MKFALKTLALSFLCIAAASADSVRIGGSTTVEVILKDKIPQTVDNNVAVVVSTESSVKGLQDLKDNKIEISLNSGGNEVFSKAGFTKDPDYAVSELVNGKVVFFVHSTNTLTSLTYDQIQDLFSGKVSNWKDVGGADKKVAIVAEGANGGLRNHLKLKEVVATAKIVKKSSEMPVGVAADESAIGYEFVADGTNPAWKSTVKELTVTGNVPGSFSLTAITKVNPSDSIKAVITALQRK